MTRTSSARTRAASILAAVCLIGAMLVFSASTASATGPITLTPASGEIAPSGSLDVVVRNTNTKKSTSALTSTVTLSPSDALFQVTNGCQGVALGKNKTCVVTIAYTGASAPAEDQTATLSVSSRKPGVVAAVTGVYTVKAAAPPIGCVALNAFTGMEFSDLQAAIDNASAGDQIVITGTCVGTFTIAKNLSLVGEGISPTLDGDHTGRVLVIVSGAIVEVSGLTIQNGTAGTAHGGGVSNSGTLTLIDSTVTSNTANEGGGIENSGTLVLRSSTVAGNTANRGGGIHMGCGGGTVRLIESTISGNTAGDSGGGMDVCGGTLILLDTSVTGNSTTVPGLGGGGILFLDQDDTFQLRGSSTVTGNTSAGQRGGIAISHLRSSVDACNSSGVDEWTGAISPNTPDDPPAESLITCT